MNHFSISAPNDSCSTSIDLIESPYNLSALIESSFSQIFQGFQKDCFEYHDQNYYWLESSYLARLFANNTLRYFLILAMKDNTNDDTFTRILQGLYDYCSHRKGKVVGWLKLAFMTPLSSFQQDLRYFVQDIQVLIFDFAHHCMSILIGCIFVFGG